MIVSHALCVGALSLIGPQYDIDLWQETTVIKVANYDAPLACLADDIERYSCAKAFYRDVFLHGCTWSTHWITL